MKFVAAKCPNCGAKLKLDKELKKSTCEFCRYDILVDEAIAKYKLELTGEVEVKNLPKVDNLLKLANRAYENGDYDEAYAAYIKVLEIDSDIPVAALRKGLTKAMTTNYMNFDINSIISGFNTFSKLEKDPTKLEVGIMETILAISVLTKFAINFKRENTTYLNDLKEFIHNLDQCLTAYEKLFNHIEKAELKKTVLENCITIINIILKSNIYLNDMGKKNAYFMPTGPKKEYKEKKKQYQLELDTLKESKAEGKTEKIKKEKVKNPGFFSGIGSLFAGSAIAVVSEKETKTKKPTKVMKILTKIVDIFFILSFIAFLVEGLIVPAILMAILIILSLNKVKDKIAMSSPKLYKFLWLVKLILFIIAAGLME